MSSPALPNVETVTLRNGVKYRRIGSGTVAAWTSDRELVVTGTPSDDDGHDCDLMGCGWDHVLYRTTLQKAETNNA